jgi:hypothetical protein
MVVYFSGGAVDRRYVCRWLARITSADIIWLRASALRCRESTPRPAVRSFPPEALPADFL